MAPKVTRKLAAILAADVAGYSRLMSEDEEGTLRRLDSYREVIERVVEEHDGRVFGSAGDSVMVEFASPVQAVRAAVRIQEELERRNAELPENRRMRLRIGINLGDILVEDDNLFGDSVNIAARLQALAEPGAICISDSVYQHVRNKLPLGYEHVGKQQLKNIPEPVDAYRVLTAPEAAGKLVERKKALANVWLVTAAAVVVIVVIAGGLALWLKPWARAPAPQPPAPVTAFPEIAVPKRHFRVERPAELSATDAYTIYDRIRSAMGDVYLGSGNDTAKNYQSWRRYNTTPYPSATHGRRFINNYANARAAPYGRFEDAGTLPEGSVLAKDSFEVTEQGDVVTGPLALMEKMAPGFDPDGRDWRYTMIMPDGTLFGTTNGENAERVEFCGGCHAAAGADRDYLYFIPRRFRRQFLGVAGAMD